ncbi:S24 family peptidase [Bacteroides cellulosilyticus]|jgi:phage repressor protein C with HTH and peptisase S24 domain|uniref:S24 family peptidase n=1 Tax=Bacteroides cellulosilyticus TaxID=246787 RepID=UPI0022E4EC6D|nr:S24 family peptidase [Bacteroides cellulosilyticus]
MPNNDEIVLSSLTKRFLSSMDYIQVTGYKLKQNGIINNEATLTKIKKGIQQPSRKMLDKYLECYSEINPAWLLTGEGEISDNRNEAKYVAPYIGENLIKVPYVSNDASASFIESLYDMEYDIDTYGVMPENGENLNDGTYMVFQVRGNSMEPTIPDHAKILTKKIDEGMWENASGVIVIVYGKTLSVKRILKNSLFGSNTLTIKADNPIHGQVDIARSEIRGIWQAIRIISQKIL